MINICKGAIFRLQNKLLEPFHHHINVYLTLYKIPKSAVSSHMYYYYYYNACFNQRKKIDNGMGCIRSQIINHQTVKQYLDESSDNRTSNKGTRYLLIEQHKLVQ